MNRPLPFGPDGGVVLRPDRVYRLLVVVNGETSAEDLEDALVAWGFDRMMLASSTPREWPRDRPPDWPEEPALETAINECVVRISGRFASEPRAFGRDMAVADSGACYTIASAWDYAPSLAQRGRLPVATGAAAPAPVPNASAPWTAVLLSAAAVVGFGVWSTMRTKERIARETERMRAAVERQEEAAAAQKLAERVAELVREGHPRHEALALAQAEIPREPLVLESLAEEA